MKYTELMELSEGFPTKMSQKNSMSQKSPCPRGKRTGKKIITAFKSSGGTKRQRLKEGTYKQVNLACY